MLVLRLHRPEVNFQWNIHEPHVLQGRSDDSEGLSKGLSLKKDLGAKLLPKLG
jgi:hypothetical protein